MEDLVQLLEQGLPAKGRPGRGSARIRGKLESFRERMPSGLHASGIDLVRSIAARAPVQAQSLLEWLPDLARILPDGVAGQGIEQAARISSESVTASYGFLSHLVHVNNALGSENLGPWVEEGIRLLKNNPSAGRAYFDLHSRSAREGLKRGDETVHLEEIRESLRLYVHGISGRRLEVQSVGEALGGFASGRPWIFPYSDGQGVFLPPAVQAFASHHENRLFYRILAAHQAGYHEANTFGFGLLAFLERLARHPVLGSWKPELQRREGKDDFMSDLQVFFHLFPRPGLAQRIFLVIEDGRVDAHLRHGYPGLEADMGPFVEGILANRPPLAGLTLGASLLEMLLRISLAPERQPEAMPPSLVQVWRLMAERLAPAFAPGAAAEDAAVAATEAYWFIQGMLRARIPLAGPRPGGENEGSAWEYLSDDVLAEATFVEGLGAELEGDAGEVESLRELDAPIEFRGDTDLGEVQKGLQMAEHLDSAATDDPNAPRQVMSLDELKRLLEMGVEITVESIRDEAFEGPGLFFQNPSQTFPLMSQMKKKQDDGKALKGQMLSLLRREHRRTAREQDATIYYYDEWDYTIQDYRAGWCRLLEREVSPEEEGFAARVRNAYGPLIPSVRRQFEQIRPEEYRREKSLLDGEEIDLDRTVEHLIDRMSGLPGTNRLYQQRRKVQRDVCTVFLVDMSSSTSEAVCVPVEEAEEGPVAAAATVDAEEIGDELTRLLSRRRSSLASVVPEGEGRDGQKRIIDVEKEALILLAEALGALGDRYGIFGFSGCGRNQVDFYTIKDCSQRYSNQVRDRIGAIEPKGSTRMGAALRHCRAKLAKEDARRKNLFLLSDGFPQDQDYGYDRTSHEYGVQDTAQALAELERDGTYTYCITVDRKGEDYLRKMCPESQYMVIHDILSLPEVLLKLYRKITA
jgi:hypothetical protein